MFEELLIVEYLTFMSIMEGSDINVYILPPVSSPFAAESRPGRGP